MPAPEIEDDRKVPARFDKSDDWRHNYQRESTEAACKSSRADKISVRRARLGVR